MSADNWTYCPRCDTDRMFKIREAAKLSESSYGKVTPEEYKKLVEAAANPPPRNQTLREDYEIGIHQGKFSISYAARCDVCKFEFTFQRNGEQVKI